MRKSLVGDALLANWDFAGLTNDNVMVTKSGKLLRIDSGGTFNFRAQGGAKDYGPVPMEMWSLRSGSQGKQFWDSADDKDYRNIWLNQADGISDEKNMLLNQMKKSNLSDDVKHSFAKRVQILSIAAGEAQRMASSTTDWVKFDQVMKDSFTDAAGLDSKDPDWGNKVQKIMRSRLDQAFPDSLNLINQSKFDLSGNGYLSAQEYKSTTARADDRLNQKISGWEAFDGISEDEKYSAGSYTSGGYTDMNKFLRKDTQFSPKMTEYLQAKCDALDGLLERLPSDPSVLFRMHKIDKVRSPDQIKQMMDLKPGDTYTTTGFDSYTRDDSGEVLSIFSDMGGTKKWRFITQYQGTQCKDVDPITSSPGEQESIMKRGTKLKVVKAEVVPSSTWEFLEGNLAGETEILLLTVQDV